MEFIYANGAFIEESGRYYHDQTVALAKKYPEICIGVEGDAHMTAICFGTVEDAVKFTGIMNKQLCVDVSAQTYKPNCPPVALTKLPLITTPAMADKLLDLFDKALKETVSR